MEAIFAILLLVAAWTGYSAISIAYPVEPFSTRGRAVISFGLSAATFLIVGGFALSVMSPSYLSDTGESGAAQAAGSGHDSALIAQARMRGDIPDPCGNGGIALRDVVAVTGNHLIRASADASAPTLKNEEASRVIEQPVVWNFSDGVITHPGIPI
jgi:hypothetical protein